MLNSLTYIPSILAYIFVALLLVILGFIIIYIAHKIYTSLYDNLPVARLSSNYSLTQEYESMSKRSLGTKAESPVGRNRKSKTALRVIVTLEPCYLAYMVFESKLLSCAANVTKLNAGISNTTSVLTNPPPAVAITGNERFLIKYFASLTSIPFARYLESCDDLQFVNVCPTSENK